MSASIAHDAVTAGCAQIQTEIFWDKLPIHDKNPARMVLGHHQDPEQYCWNAYIRLQPNATSVVPPDIRHIISSKLRDNAIRDVTTIKFALNGGTNILVDRPIERQRRSILSIFNFLNRAFRRIF